MPPHRVAPGLCRLAGSRPRELARKRPHHAHRALFGKRLSRRQCRAPHLRPGRAGDLSEVLRLAGRSVGRGLRRRRRADDPALQGHRRGPGALPQAARDLPHGRRLRQPGPQGCGRTPDHDPQRAGLRHHRSGRPRHRPGAVAAPRPAAAPPPAAPGPAGAVALRAGPADPPLLRADLRHHRHGPHRHRRRAARQGVRLPRGVLRPVPARTAPNSARASSAPARWRSCCA